MEPRILNPRRRDQGRLELERIASVARRGLEQEYLNSPGLPDDFRLDTFVIVPAFVWRDGEFDVDATSVWGESRRSYVQTGVLTRGLEMLAA